MSSQKIVRFDWAMKYLLRNKANYDIVEGFLCALLEDNNITVLNISESEGNQENSDDKFNRVDVLVKDSQGRNIIIEFKVNQSAKTAIKQIRDKKYALKYADDKRPIILLGINFDTTKKLIEDYLVEDYN